MAQISINSLDMDLSADINALIANQLDLVSRVTVLESTVVQATYGNPPGAPTIGTVTVPSGSYDQVLVPWTAPTNVGNSPISTYTVTAYDLLGNLVGTFAASASATSITISQLPASGSPYTFTVLANNQAGQGPVSAMSNAVTVTDPPPAASVPGAPTIGTPQAGANLAYVFFTAPVSDGGAAITGYLVTASNGQTASGTSSPITVSGLTGATGGTQYTFQVQAINSAGTGPLSAVSAAVTISPPVVAPGAPTTVSVAVSGSTAQVSFVAPSINGNASITGYTVTTAGQAVTVGTGTTSPIALTGLVAGSYTLTVTATNGSFTSAPSTQVSFTIAAAATAGTNLLPMGVATTSGGTSGYYAVATSGTAPTLNTDTTTVLAGTQSLRATAQAASTFVVVTNGNSAPVTTGATVSALASIRSGTATTAKLSIQWFNSSYALVSTSTASSDTTVAANTWIGLTFTTTVPTGTGVAFAQIVVNVDTAATVGQIYNLDNFEVATGTVAAWTAPPGSAVNALPAAQANGSAATSAYKTGSNSGTAPTLTSNTSVVPSGTSTSIQATLPASPSYVSTSGVMQVTPGTTISGLVSVYLASRAGTVAPQISFFSDTAGATYLSNVTGTAVSAPQSTWESLTMTATVPTGAQSAEVQGNVTSTPTAGDLAYFSLFELAAGTVTTWTAGS